MSESPLTPHEDNAGQVDDRALLCTVYMSAYTQNEILHRVTLPRVQNLGGCKHKV